MKGRGFVPPQSQKKPETKSRAGSQFARKASFYSVQGLEKILYLTGLPLLMAFGAYSFYRMASLKQEQQAKRYAEVESKYINKDHDNIIKLQNFNKRVYAIGVYDEFLDSPEMEKVKDTDDFRRTLIKNAKMIKNVI